MTTTDSLIELAKKLREARALGEGCSDPAALYFIDMTIAHVCASLNERSGVGTSKDRRARVVGAAA